MNNTTAIAACTITRLALTPRDIQDFKNAYPSPWRAPTPTPTSTTTGTSTATTATEEPTDTSTTTTATEEPTDTSTTTTATEEPTDTSTTTTATEEPTDTSTTTTATEEPTDTPTTTTATEGPTDTPTETATAAPVRYCRLRFVVGSGAGRFTTNPASGVVQCGQPVSYWATAGTGYCFSRWGGASLGASGQASCRTSSGTLRIASLTADITFTAHFTKKRYTLRITKGTGGSISPSAGTHTYTHGTRVTIRATPLYRFRATWGGACSGSRNTCTVVMTGPRSVSVTFSHIGGGLSDEGGTATPTATATAAPTATATPTATPTPSATSTPAATPPPGPSGQ